MHKILFSFIFITSFTFGQLDEAKRITQTLCSESFHGRGYVNKGDSIAGAFILSEFKKLGLKPLKGQFEQKFELQVNTFPDKMEVRQGARELKAGEDFIVNPSSGGGVYKLIPKLIPAHIALDKELLIQELNVIKKLKTHNAIALDFRNLSPDSLKLGSGLAQELGMVIHVIELSDKKFTWSVSDQQLQHVVLHIQAAKYINNEPIEVNISASLLTNYRSKNILAYLPAKKNSAKTIVFTAHYDHLGRMGKETYFPGANDNASGTAMLLYMANYFKQNPSDYNILFIAFAGEEAGLIGSKYFVENPLLKLKKIKFLVNLDIMGSGEEGITVVNATLHPEAFESLQQINKEHNYLSQVKSRGPAANSDHYWFSQKKVPAFFIYTMGPNKNYHDVFDTYENLSFNEFEDLSKLLIAFVGQL